MKNFLTRTLTGIFIVIFVLGGIYLHPLSFIFVGLVIIVGSQLELFRLILAHRFTSSLVRGLLLSLPVYLLSPFVALEILPARFLLVPVLMLILLFVSELYSKKGAHPDAVAKIIFASLYTTLPYLLMVFSTFGADGKTVMLWSRSVAFSPMLVLGFFILLWVNDTGAYLLGVTFGKHKLFKSISPKKSWEGFIGGVLLTIIAAWFLGRWIELYSPLTWIVSGLIISVSGTFGDLFESNLKREAGVKDSGKILPGHGGFLDRFDGVTFAFPILYLYITFFG